MCALEVSISRRPISGPYKTAAPALTFPISCRDGGVRADVGGACAWVSRVGARFTQSWPRSFVRENRGPTGDLLPIFYLGAPTTASRQRRRYEKSPHGTRSGSVGALPPSLPRGGHICVPTRGRGRGKVSRQPAASAARPVGDFRCVSRDTHVTSRKGVLGLFKAIQKNRPFVAKSRPFPALAPQTQKRPVERHGPHTLTTKTALFCGKVGVWGPRDTRA